MKKIEDKQNTPIIIKEEEISNPIKIDEPKKIKLTPIRPYPIIAFLGYLGMLFFYLTPVLTFLSSIAVFIYAFLQITSNYGILKIKETQLESPIMAKKTVIAFVAYLLLILISFIAMCNGAISLDFISLKIYGPECKLNPGYLIMYLVPILSTPGCYWLYLYLIWNKKIWNKY